MTTQPTNPFVEPITQAIARLGYLTNETKGHKVLLETNLRICKDDQTPKSIILGRVDKSVPENPKIHFDCFEQASIFFIREHDGEYLIIVKQPNFAAHTHTIFEGSWFQLRNNLSKLNQLEKERKELERQLLEVSGLITSNVARPTQ